MVMSECSYLEEVVMSVLHECLVVMSVLFVCYRVWW